MKQKKLSGVIAAAATPINDNFTINHERLAEHCRWLLSNGCDGINLLGTTGEATSFSVTQRIEAMRYVAKAGLPLDCIMVGTGAAALEDSIHLTCESKSLGFAGALLLPPFYYKGLSDENIGDFINTVISAAGKDGLALYLYNIPQNTGLTYSASLIAKLRGQHEAVIAGLKDSSGNLEYARSLATEFPDMAIFPSSENLLEKANDYFFAGCISASVNITAPFAASAWKNQGSQIGKEACNKAAAIREILATNDLVPAVKWALSRLTGDHLWNRLCPPLNKLHLEASDILGSQLASTAFAELGDGRILESERPS